MGPGQYPRYTDARKGRPWVAQKHHRRQRLDNKTLKQFVEHLHGSGAGSKEPQSCEALSMLGDKNTFRNQQEVPEEIPQEIPQENSEKQPDHTFKVVKTLNVMDQFAKKLTSQVTDAGCQDIAEVKDTIEESDLPKNTKSSTKYKTAIDEPAETVEKTKTAINNAVMCHHDEATHPDEVHEECAVQFS